MKKIISVLLSVIMVFSLVSVSAAAADDGMKITTATDLHYSQAGADTKLGAHTAKDFSHAVSSGELHIESGAIIDAFLDAAAANGSEYVLLSGDLTDRGLVPEHEVVSEKLTAFEKETGIPVFVVPGNHDYLSTVKAAEFKSFYADFGYNEAITVDESSGSYVAELSDGYRLLAIDSNKVDQARASWIKAQAEQAQKDGKKLIAMMHHNLLNHFVFGDFFKTGSYLDPALGISELFAEYNIRYTFSGHTHSHDIKAYTGANGVTVYDILTSTLNAYPCPYRVVTFGKKVEIRTEKVTSIDASCLKGKVTDYCYSLAAEDFSKYAEDYALYGFDIVIASYLSASSLKNLLRIDAAKNPEMAALIDELTPVIKEIAYMPIYTADETEQGKSLQSLGAKAGIALPETEFGSIAELAVFFYRAYGLGDENYGLMSTEYQLLTSAAVIALSYILKDVSAEEYAAVLNFICSFVGKSVPAVFINYAADAVSRIRGIEILVTSVLGGIILQFTTDDGTADNNVTLSGYDELPKDEIKLTLFDKFVSFLLKIFDFFLRFFGTGR